MKDTGIQLPITRAGKEVLVELKDLTKEEMIASVEAMTEHGRECLLYLCLGYAVASKAQIDELEKWKNEALIVFSRCDAQAIGKLLGMPIGTDVFTQLQPAIEKLQAQRANSIQALHTAINTLRSLEHTLSTIDSDERYRARREKREPILHKEETKQSQKARDVCEKAILVEHGREPINP